MLAQLQPNGQFLVSGSSVTQSGTGYSTDSLNTPALWVTGSDSSYNGTDITLRTVGSGSIRNGVPQGPHAGARVDNGGWLSLTDTEINTVGYVGLGVSVSGSSSGVLQRVNITTVEAFASAVFVEKDSTLLITGGTLATAGTDARGLWTHSGGTINASLVTLHASGPEGHGLLASGSGVIHINDSAVITDGAATTRGLLAITGGEIRARNLTLTSELTAVESARDSIVVIESSTVHSNAGVGVNSVGGEVKIQDSDITNSGTASVIVALGGTLAITGGTIAATGDGNLLTVSGSNTLNVTLDNVDTSGAGGITVNDTFTGTANLTVSAGSGLHGDITNTGSGVLTVNLNNSAITSDVINQGDGALVITLDNNSTGTGGITDSDLIIGKDSAWTFNKDSHGNYGENHGVWNIGDYEVIFDNLTHTGTVNISVNSDTGAGGSLTITDTADGDGTVHINTTGNGKADPNKVLPGIVSGDGTEHWQWDPIDWGIDTIIKDGDHFIKQGTSSAGAVLNSAIAVQQSMWFAQQNSLLKRMGELRYGARASRPLADKDVRVPYHSLIENIWLRSYGQQLNIGSQVSGKAYEQLIYGVDLGTDHKFTLSTDSDLYLGVFAGYGRSDIDYRTPNTDGELNSYYGGLYATWLHSSGFYIDATFKAASIDNDLKAPYDNTQLTASYSDVNIGGSLEIGNKFTFQDGWFVEPQFQVNYLHILAEDYTAGPMTISAQDLDALQLRLGSLFGRTINLTNGGALQPYIKISGVETICTGGTIRNGYQHTRANTDGVRAELGAGLIWQLDADN
ncbi:MAG: autotransporter outer membrane beta-barrel domain-containing protein, partial [Verrucomicrobiales bacterium]|nr:autotransporter outer membrane beta-barrel domain-containing protein [Verrucomicrobiales bacterium]